MASFLCRLMHFMCSGMGICYEKSYDSCSDEYIESVTAAGGYPELAPVIRLSSAALGHCSSLQTFQYLELLVTSAGARGRGVGTAIVQCIQGNPGISL